MDSLVNSKGQVDENIQGSRDLTKECAGAVVKDPDIQTATKRVNNLDKTPIKECNASENLAEVGSPCSGLPCSGSPCSGSRLGSGSPDSGLCQSPPCAWWNDFSSP